MVYPDIETEIESELKCERIASKIEVLILDGILAALERLSVNLKHYDIDQKTSSDDYPSF